jgi:PelA/Pel-15E family pectate lyase
MNVREVEHAIRTARRSLVSMTRITSTAVAILLGLCATVQAGRVGDYRDQPDAWFTTDDGRAILANVLAAQRSTGGWYKNYDLAKPPAKVATSNAGRSIFDNMATIGELRLLARAIRVTGDADYRAAFDRGMQLVLDAQYENGGWPQEFPLPAKGYAGQITYNDNAMTRVMQFCKDVAEAKPDFAFVASSVREKARAAFERGIECTLNAQISIKGTPTVWCAQYDPVTLEPAKARAYELPSLSGDESAGITLLLMSIDSPSERVKQSVQHAVAWFERAKLTGIRTEKRSTSPEEPGKSDIVVIEDANAEPLWGRFYDLETGKPYFCGRDGVKKATLAEIERERRTGYAWLRPWGKPVLAAYPAWAQKHGLPNVLAN